jgi:hypothetical protein
MLCVLKHARCTDGEVEVVQLSDTTVTAQAVKAAGLLWLPHVEGPVAGPVGVLVAGWLAAQPAAFGAGFRCLLQLLIAFTLKCT